MAIFLRLLLFRTRIGIAMRAVVDDRDLTALNGGRPSRVSALSWALGTMLAALAGILLAPKLGLSVLNLTFLVISAYAAAIVGQLKSLPLTFAGALALGLAEAYAIGYLPTSGFLSHIKPTLPMSHVIGQRACPEHMGVDRGVQVSSQMLDAWRNGERPSVAVWNDLGVADAWRMQIAGLRLIDYKLEDSGCWERLAPVTTTRTWHQFRVTVQRGDGERFSKVVTVHTRAARDGWRVAEIEGLEL